MAAFAIGGCHQNLTMSDQKKLAEWERSSIFRNGRVLQAPPAGSVSREAEIGNVLAARPPMTLALVKRGHERFDVFCSECHGYGGDADYQSDDSKYGLIGKSEQAGFIAVFPNGTSRFKSGSRV